MDWPWTNMGDYHRANPIYRILDGLVGQCPKRITNRVQGPFSDTSWRNSCVLEKEFRSPTTFSHSKLDGFPILTIDMLFYNWFCVFFLRIQTSAIFLGHFLWFSSTKFLNCEPYVVVFWTLRDSHPDSSALHPLHPIIHNKQAPNRQEKTHIYQLIGGIPTPWKKWKSDWIIIPTTGENKKVPVTTNQKTYLPLFWTPRTTNFMEFLHLSVFLVFFSWFRSPLVTERVRPLRVKRNGAQTPPDAVVMVNLSQTWSNLGYLLGIPNPGISASFWWNYCNSNIFHDIHDR